eukprot:CAMPEP_0182425366 /NCGR_PEP_ID=MMETSP1167-20130531/11776_1 /TAXON_ID=2988 /ORGANISM="Mallomonas Sp, Strain CCMP3275" /LENGTH=45 /DNA_ID= /DNA_START= /DNA_END= /DNA_ORIENTATION=
MGTGGTGAGVGVGVGVKPVHKRLPNDGVFVDRTAIAPSTLDFTKW